MRAIIKRELSAYFISPIGYGYLAVMYFLEGFYFFTDVLMNNSTDFSPLFTALLTVVMFLTPILTMRLMAEDRRLKTDQALLTAPITLAAIVCGKFIAAALINTAGVSITLVYALVLSAFARGAFPWAIIWGNYIALLLLGFAFIAIGQFISALTENQAIAAIGAFIVMLFLFLLDTFASLLPSLAPLINGVSFMKRYMPITSGILDIADLCYFISVCAVFLFLTTRVLEKRRWA
jgi:ABC-2 type transport system permease protein